MNEANNNLLSLEAEVTGETKEQLDAIGRWATYSAIVGFITLGLSVISIIVNLNKVSQYGTGMGSSGILQSFLVSIFTLLINIILYLAGMNIKKGISTGDQGFFNLGLRKLNNYFKILGILMIIVMSIILLAVVFGGLATVMR